MIMSISSKIRTALLMAFAAVGLVTTSATPSHAQAVEYVKVCSLFGAGFFYIPGTDTCTQAGQIVQNEQRYGQRYLQRFRPG